MKHKQYGFAALEIILVLIIVGLLGFIGWNYMQQNGKNNKSADAAQTASTKKATPTPAAVEYGTIKGKASYPAEALPADEEVCAQKIDDASAKPVCINVGKTQTINYELKVPTGDYYVYSTSAQFPTANYRAYYNEYVKCGLQYTCPASGHLQYIKVSVAKDALVSSVDPGDWYAD